MGSFASQQKVITGILIVGTVLAFLVLKGFPDKASSLPAQPTETAQVSSTDKPQIVSTKPDPLDNNIITAADIIEITFNRSLENVGEFKVRIEPNIEYKVELSGDRTTARIIPAKPYQLNMSYTLFIGAETKFDGIGRWGEEKVFHFRTITYKGV